MNRALRFGVLYLVAIAGGIVAGIQIFDAVAN